VLPSKAEHLNTSLEFPASANQPRKLPYVLRPLVFVDASGKVKIEKNGDVDNDFFKKAKDAAKNWRTTIPRVGGKPAKVGFPLEIKFERQLLTHKTTPETRSRRISGSGSQ
jgi:hypothetical protein